MDFSGSCAGGRVHSKIRTDDSGPPTSKIIFLLILGKNM